MRFIVVSASTLKELADKLNDMSLGTGRPLYFTVNKTGEYETLVDLSPVHVVTNDDLLIDVDMDENMPKGIVMAA
jgi:hypothetical protein